LSVALLAVIIAFAAVDPGETAAAGGDAKLVVYFWRGKGTGSFLPDAKYQGFIKSIFRGHEVVFDNQPPRKATVLDNLARADIAYINAHAGYLASEGANPPEHFLWAAGSKGDADYALTALDLAARRKAGARLPTLVILGACETLSSPPKGAKLLQLAGGFGLTSATTDRALIGFAEKIEGYKCDGFFRVFLAKWTTKQPDGTYPTLQQAQTAATDFMDNYTLKFGNNDKLYMNRTYVHVGRDLRIFCGSELRFSDVLKARAKRDQ
jgi:hypothetical protein